MIQKTSILLYITIIFCFGCAKIENKNLIYESGVSQELATLRAANIKDVIYDISFNIPSEKDSSVHGALNLKFNLNKKNYKESIILDFKEDINNILSVVANDKECSYIFKNEHIIIPKKYLHDGENNIFIEFIAGEQSLNRNDDYNYTLLVPDRARTLFPCFDQPNLKAEYNLSLTIPQAWEAIANSPAKDTLIDGNVKTITFAPTEPLSTYLFSFVSGIFQKSIHSDGKREIKIYQRESEKQKTDQLDDIRY